MLKEKLIEFLEKNSRAVDMGIWIEKTDRHCGTNGCLAGNIVLVGNGFDYNDIERWFSVKDSFLKNPRYLFWVEYERELWSQRFNRDCSEEQVTVPAAARCLWEKEYGEQEAKNLPFYKSDWKFISRKSFFDISSEDLLEWLKK